jgi:hypothetical protein
MANASQPVSARWIGLTADATAPAAGDTTLSGEIVGGGFTRAVGTYAHTGSTASYTVSLTFTAASTATISKMGVFNAVTSGTLVFESLVANSPTLVSGDTLTVVSTVSL